MDKINYINYKRYLKLKEVLGDKVERNKGFDDVECYLMDFKKNGSYVYNKNLTYSDDYSYRYNDKELFSIGVDYRDKIKPFTWHTSHHFEEKISEILSLDINTDAPIDFCLRFLMDELGLTDERGKEADFYIVRQKWDKV